ncbi:MFS transporter [Pseudonocardia sp. CA-107938]|uniref:MFS transporter n=1 Tax=Pseudonocardia sp. CA-107938 TaxID=3240021 RepID=UPI003D8CDA21
MIASPPTARRGHRYLALAALALPTLLIAVDISVMTVALPSIARALEPSAAGLLWIADSYNYLVACAMLTMGAVADRYGRRRTIIVCAAVFAVASAAGAFAPTVAMLIVARAVMGVAGSAIMPASMALIGELFTEEKARVQAMGGYMTVFLCGMAVAPFIGGLLLEHFWWGSVFLVGVPVMVVTMIAVPLLLPEGRTAGSTARIDLVSAGQSIGAVLGIVHGLKTAVNDGVGPTVWVALVAGVVLAVLFVRRQRRLADPLVDLALLAKPQVGRSLAALFLTALVMGGTSLFFGLYLQEVQGLTPLEAAWWTLPQILLMIAASNVGPLLYRRYASGPVVTVMLLIMASGMVLYVLAPVSAIGRPLVAAGAALATFGIGAAFPLLMDAVIRTSPPERAGAGAALAQVSNELGIALGLTLLGSLGTVVYRAVLGLDGPAAADVVSGVERAHAAGDGVLLDAVRSAFTSAYNVVGVVGVALVLVSLWLLRSRLNAGVNAARS